MKVMEKIELSKLKPMCYTFGVIYILSNITCIVVYLVVLKAKISRKLQIVISYKATSLLPSIPYFVGLCYEEIDLLLPNMFTYVFTMVADILLMAFWNLMPPDPNYLLALSAVGILISVICALCTFLLIKKLTLLRRDEGEERKKFGDYSLTRFDAIPVYGPKRRQRPTRDTSSVRETAHIRSFIMLWFCLLHCRLLLGTQKRHICSNVKEVTYPVKTMHPYYKPVARKISVGFGDNQLCNRVRMEYHRAYRQITTSKQVKQLPSYHCCPGWARDSSDGSHGCNIPICNEPCMNGGICIKPNFCKCRNGFTGHQCEHRRQNPVYNIVCQNGGKWENPENRCSCPKGFHGPLCELDIDECKEHKPCDHICHNTHGRYKCECKEGFTLQSDGESCRKAVCNAICQNGGQCINPGNRCSCLKGFQGQLCEHDIDECKEHKPCDHICHNAHGSYKCECKEGFTLHSDRQSCHKEDYDEDSIEGNGETFELLDKRLLRLEQMMNEVHNNEVTKSDINNVYKNINHMTREVISMKNSLSNLESYKKDLLTFKKRLDHIEQMALQIDDLVKRYDRMKRCAFHNKICI